MDFRTARPEDVAEVVDLVESAYRGDSSRAGWTTEADLLEGQRTDAEAVHEVLPHLTLAFDDDELVGCCTIVPKDGHSYFGMFAVRPGLQGSGMGSALIAEAERVAARHGSTYLEMTVITARTDLIAYYVRRGYTDTGELRPFPYGDERFGKPLRDDLAFTVLTKPL